MHRLPDVHIPRFYPGLRIRSYLRCLGDVPPDEKYCAVRVTTVARLPYDTERKAKLVSNIPFVTLHTSWSASERAVSVISEEAAHFGWHFHIPMKRSPFDVAQYPTLRREVDADTAHAVEELLAIVDSDQDPSWHDMLHDIGAKGRRRIYLAQSRRPEIYALGVRVQISSSGLTSVA